MTLLAYKPNRLSVLTVVIACSMLLCARSRPGAGYIDVIPEEMQRLIADKYGEGLHAVGAATASREESAVRMATVEARAELARQFKTQVDALQKSFEEVVNYGDVVEYQQAVEILSSLELSGSTIAKSMVDNKKRGLYSAKVLVIISADQLKKLVDDKTRTYTSFRASKAYKDLENRVAREKMLFEQ
ncbi:MAG: hypothetical protein GF344_14575 [Chitinivibrionales bacterium]|nr:hypothetical protein [Chitinivibrionales bacterium]MBD3357946.1 hypothetical protein [Chitinivibrionales bacterium]